MSEMSLLKAADLQGRHIGPDNDNESAIPTEDFYLFNQQFPGSETRLDSGNF